MSTATFRGATETAFSSLIINTPFEYSFGGGSALFVGRVAIDTIHPNTVRSLLHFDLSSLPPGAILTGASLRLTFLAAMMTEARVLCSRITQANWVRNATWIHYDEGLAWAVPGGDFDDTDHDSLLLQIDETGQPSSPVVFDGLLPLARDAIAHRDNKLLLLLRLEDETADLNFAMFWSDQADLDSPPQDSSVFPVLEINYLAPSPSGALAFGMQRLSLGFGG